MPKKKQPDEYAVGYGKPPVHTRFAKGKSGNPGGRPRGVTAGRATQLACKEFYRIITVRDGDKTIRMPAIQAVLRSQVAQAAKGNASAQRQLIMMAQAIDKALAAQTESDDALKQKTPMSDIEAARRISAALLKVAASSSGEKG